MEKKEKKENCQYISVGCWLEYDFFSNLFLDKF